MPSRAFSVHRSRSCALVVLLLPAALLLSTAPAVAAAPSQLVFAPHLFETARHGPHEAELGFLEVPRRHAHPDGAMLRLRVVRLRATGDGPHAAPVVYLAGGPGGSGVGTARGPRWPVFDRVRREADILLLDQRGTGLSEPPPTCPHTTRFDDARPLERDAALAAMQATATRCIDVWRAAGVDLAAYTTQESAHDIEHLRQALGVPRLSLWGMSYGTHLALATLRLHGPSIDRAVLIGAEGPDQTLKAPLSADRLLADLSRIAADAGFDDTEAATRRVLDTLQRQPARVRSLRGREVAIGAFDAQLAIANALGRRQTQQLLPLAIRDAERGDYALLAELVLAVRDHLGDEMRAMPLAMDVASGHSVERRALVAAQARDSLFGDALDFPFPMLGDALDLSVLGDEFRAPLHSDVPALFVSGTLDGRTPPDNARALLPGFPQAGHLLVHGASHDDELWLGHPDIAERIAGFVAGRPAVDQTLYIPAPVFATGRLDLLLHLFGIGRPAAFTAAASAVALVLGMCLLVRRWWRARRARAAGDTAGRSHVCGR